MRWTALPLACGFVILTWTLAGGEPAGKADLDTHRAVVVPFLAAHCTKCHGETKQLAKLDLRTLEADIVAGKSLDRWLEVASRLKAGEMPPEGEKQPDPALIKKVTDWIDGELVKAGKTNVVAKHSIRSGNQVPHDLLFGPKATAAFESPPRLWRLSPPIYAEFIKGLNKNMKLAQPFALPAGAGFKDVAGDATIDESTAAQLIRNAEAIVSEQLGLAGKGPTKIKEFAPLLEEQTPANSAQVEVAIAKQFELVLKRKPTAEELRRFAAFHQQAVKTGGAAVGTRVVLTAVFLLPEANFRRELGQGPADPEGRRMLAPREIAFALAYALTDRAPDGILLQAADKGKLATQADVTREVQRLFEDAKTDKPRILRFFREYFGYADAVLVFKDQKEFGSHHPSGLVEDTDRLILDILREDKNVLVELLTTTKSYVHHKNADQNQKQIAEALAKYEEEKKRDPKKRPPNVENKLTYKSYNLDDFPATQPTELPREQRAGILTQPSWLVANSESFQNHAIRRGKWIRERLLGGTVPDLPITVDAQLPEDPHKTLRQRMEITKQEYCWQCHQKMNPIGLTFENYDHFGRFRTTELDKPVETAGQVDYTGDPVVDGQYADSLALLRKLAATDRARQVFIRHAFRYWMGREETPGDARSLMAIDDAYVKSGGSMKALLTALLTSDSFLYRTVSK